MLLLEQDMSANTLCVMGSTPIRIVVSGSSVGQSNRNSAGSNPAYTPKGWCNSSDGRALHW